jgi:hypothetical protein
LRRIANTRYAIALPDGTRVGFVLLPQPPGREHEVRLQALPAFRVAREARRRYRQFLRGRADHTRLTEEDMVAEEEGLAALGGLELELVKESGRRVINATVRLIPGEPPRVRISFSRLSARPDRDLET